MSKRYGTLDVSLNMSRMSRSNPHRLNKTIQAPDQQDPDRPADQQANKFRQLYYKNERLRKELKLLNQKLNERLDKLKLPPVKKKAMSVDLNRSPPAKPSKALVRQLQNGYKQIGMYKKQVESLKGKEETPENYSKLRSVEDMITYMDMEINNVQEQLKSQKNIKKMQDKVIAEDVDNAQIRQRVKDYENQIKNHREKIKELEVKSRKRQKQFKKQQAYSVALQDKVRKFRAEEEQLQKEANKPPPQIPPAEFNAVKEELNLAKSQYDNACTRIQTQRKKIRDYKLNKTTYEETFISKEGLLKTLHVQVESYRRLLKDLQAKKYEQTGIRQQERLKWAAKQLTENKILKLQEIEDDLDESPVSQSKRQRESSHNHSFVSRNTANDERNWKGKMKKVSMGYTMPTDQTFTENGILLGLKAYFDQNRYIVGLAPIMLVEQTRSECPVQGDTTNIEIKWQVQGGDQIAEIYGSFTEQGYLAEVILKTWRGTTGTFGSPQDDKFHFRLQYGQYFSGMFGGYRRLGQDVRFTQIGFWTLKP